MAASAKLLRQYQADYQKKLAKEQGAYEDRYAGYKTQFDQYARQATAYNQKIDQFNAAGAAMTPGDIYQNESGTLTQFDENGNPVAYGGPGGGPGDWFGDEFGTTGTTITTGTPYRATNGAWYYDVMQTTAGTPESYDEYGQPIATTPGTTTKVDTKYIPVKAFHPGVAPSAPADPALPNQVRAPSFTVGDIREMTTPGQDQAGLAMSAARGYIAKSQLAAENDPGKNSAFANLAGDDPNNLKQAGVLSRVIAGQL